ncbi:ATP-binding cassette domain-containing protein [Yokenella regensburgei]|jgi:D-methionine transport system ATP-binding protein|nr:ATP-binding cassette domain-containing protein [Yokenella regensburgei]
MIALRNISKIFAHGKAPLTAVDDVSLSVEQGQIYGIIGYSGAGKSTLIRLLNGLEKPTSGSVTVNGHDIGAAKGETLRQARLKISMVFQHFNLLWSRTVSENIAFSMQIAGTPKAQIRTRVAELIELVGLTGREHAYPSQLSGGQKQRVGIARALANHPDVLLCDEATSALDPMTTDQILDLLLDINQRFGLTIVLITHEMHVVRKICDRVAVMEEGRVVEEGLVAQVFSQPQQPITRQFVRQVSQYSEVLKHD